MTASEIAMKFFRIRLPESMHNRIVARAQKNHRRINAEIVAMLESKLEEEKK